MFIVITQFLPPKKTKKKISKKKKFLSQNFLDNVTYKICSWKRKKENKKKKKRGKKRKQLRKKKAIRVLIVKKDWENGWNW